MPTRDDFQQAAELFASASDHVGELMVVTRHVDPVQALFGGRLGAQVPERIDHAMATAAACRSLIDDAVETCRVRAAVIAEYEAQLAIFDTVFDDYLVERSRWTSRWTDWFYDDEYLTAHPGPEPREPEPPPPPPEWADVRRP